MNIKFSIAGFFVVVFLVLATSEWTSKVSSQGDSSLNSTESEGSLRSLTPQEKDTTSEGIGASIPSSSTTGNWSSRANTTA